MRDPVGAPASWLARAIRDGRLSSEEVVRAHLEHIGAVNPRLNAIVWVTNESAIRQAKAADRHLAKRGFEPPPLHGVPFTAKDIFDTAGVATTAGLRKLKNNVPDKDATVIARMRSAGAILLGKSSCPPGGSGGQSWNPLHGGTRNPYDLARSPGASSSGEAAIIAAAGSPLGIGSDSGGSIRLPAHYCGIAALKPTTGWVPSTGAYGLVGGLMDPRSQVGPMARYVNDLTLTPVAAEPAPLYRAKIPLDDQYSYTVPYSLGGNPAVVVRAGTSPEGLPIGVQVVARNWRDYTALAAAAWIEKQLGGWRPASLGAGSFGTRVG